MEQLSARIADRMIYLDIIISDDKEIYCYSVQGQFEKTKCLMLIIVLLFLLHSIFEVIAFLSVFMLIRRSSDGIHRKVSPVLPWPICMIFLHQPKRPKKLDGHLKDVWRCGPMSR